LKSITNVQPDPQISHIILGFPPISEIFFMSHGETQRVKPLKNTRTERIYVVIVWIIFFDD
jgi:hypothetical protein